MLDRIQELLRVRELSSSQFADAIGVSRPVVSHILSGRNKPSLEVVQKVIAAFPDLSLSWLLNGTGSMLERVAVAEVAKASVASAATVPRAQPVTEPAPIAAPLPTVVAAPVPQPPLVAAEPVEALKQAVQPRVAGPVVAVEPATSVATPAGADLAYALAEPGKTIRRIVLFYQDGTFTDFRPETGA
ncbi:helix-turn-helix domain-containing protein [Hymenobacter terrestris]|uniref:Helix-turn-helix domain-containing protein n=1 Tax=Hymenobacter terrestris TaxID=2748310 RepID=A0ABX2Q268_9BACT|nr:helix-turn-helix transcriptional regulator [Hymenobacter terrestris]NVO84624.1 helix-turn-helix domain-containing protein [Hymenobacter terrestris]